MRRAEVVVAVVSLFTIAMMMAAPTSVNESPTDEWPTFHRDWARTGYTTSEVPRDLQLLWSFQAGNPTNANNSSNPAVAQGKVFLVADPGYGMNLEIYAIDAGNGSFVWKYQTNGLGEPSTPSPSVVGGRVYVGSGDNYLYALNAENGELIWRFDVKANGRDSGFIQEVTGAPAVVDGRVYFGSWNGYMFALDAENGDLIWKFNARAHIGASPAVVGGIVYITTLAGDYVYQENKNYTGHVYALNAENGALIWDVDIYDFGIGAEIVSAPVVTDNKLFIGGGWPSDNQVYCFDARNGSFIWKFEASNFVGTPAVANGTVYFHTQVGDLYALGAENGEVIWRENIGGGEGFASPVVAGWLIIDTGGGCLHVLDAKTGTKIWNCDIGDDINSSPAIANGKIYVFSMNGKLYCFGQPPAQPSSIIPQLVLGVLAVVILVLMSRLVVFRFAPKRRR